MRFSDSKHRLLTYLLTPWCRVLLEKLTGLQLVKKFPAFRGTRKFITALTSVRHLSLSWASPIQSIYIPTSHLLEFHPNIIHPSTPSLSLKSSSSCLLFLLRRLPITYIFLPSFPQSVPTQDVTNAISVTSFYCK